MAPSNGGGTNVLPMEMEALTVTPVRAGKSKNRSDTEASRRRGGNSHTLMGQVCMLIKLWMELYPVYSSIVVFGLVGFTFYFLVVRLMQPAELHRNKMNEDYSAIEMNYNFKASEIKHWCLWGDDDKCPCEDFTTPVGRLNDKVWRISHENNLHAVQSALDNDLALDVVFIGDEFVEGLTGHIATRRSPESGEMVEKAFNRTFTKDGGGNFEGLALGIFGDSSTNLIWRLQHGEMPENFRSNVWWLWIGTNDLSRGGCSEQATTLGILRAAEEIAFRDPDAEIVIQGILPRSRRPDGNLMPISPAHHARLFGRGGDDQDSVHPHSIEMALQRTTLWPSIQAVNKELQEFCEKHPRMIYFDAASLFLGRMQNEHYQQASQQIMVDLMSDYVHPSTRGYETLMRAIKQEVERILFDEDEENDIIQSKADLDQTLPILFEEEPEQDNGGA